MSDADVNYRFRSDRDELWTRFKDHISKNETVSEKLEELIERYVAEQTYIQTRDDLDDVITTRVRAELEAYHDDPDRYADQTFPVDEPRTSETDPDTDTDTDTER